MEIKEEELLALFKDEESVKILSTLGRNGVPHSAVKQSLHVDEDGNIRYFELLEHSKSNQNITYSLWFSKPVSINITGHGGRSYEIIGTPVRALITGEAFQAAYIAVRRLLGGETDLSTVWVIRPEEVRNLSYSKQREAHTKKHPFAVHLDRLAVIEGP
jgi:hypothetical protein